MARAHAHLPLCFALAGILFVAVPASAGPPQAPDYAGRVDIGGRRIYLDCRGSGGPTVILLSGYRNDADIWSVDIDPAATMVLPGVAGFTRVCAYDRPGTVLDEDHLSRSDPVAMPRTAEDIVRELHALAGAAGLAGPYVLVAHSLGGLFARLYAATYPGEVAGLVLVDAWQEDLPDLLGPAQWNAYVELARPPPPGLEGYRDLEEIDFAAASATMRRVAAEHPLPPMPVAVISRGKPAALPANLPAGFSADAFDAAWRAGQARLAALRPDALRITAQDSDHYAQLSEPDLVIDATRSVVAAARGR
jgi:pimeloyl-ACP methyl ester carboxylesterase